MRTKQIVLKLVCAGVIAALVFPMGNLVFPEISEMGRTPFALIEAMVSATLAFGLYGALFI